MEHRTVNVEVKNGAGCRTRRVLTSCPDCRYLLAWHQGGARRAFALRPSCGDGDLAARLKRRAIRAPGRAAVGVALDEKE